MYGFWLLIYRVSASSIRTSRMRIAYSRRIRSTWRLPRALRKTSENNIFKPNKPEKIPERLVRYRSAVEMQCFRNCTLSSLLLTRSVAPRHLNDHCTSQNAIFSNKKKKMLIICHIDWSEVGVAVELQCLRNCTLSSLSLVSQLSVNYVRCSSVTACCYENPIPMVIPFHMHTSSSEVSPGVFNTQVE